MTEDTAETPDPTTETTEATPKKGRAAKTPAAAPEGPIRIERIQVGQLFVPIIGTAPLIMHRFSEKARATMLAAQQGKKGSKPTEARDPNADYEASMYYLPDGGVGYPVVAFKAATIAGARFYRKITMAELKMMLYFRGTMGVDGQELARIDGPHKMREDYVRLGMSGTDLRFRAEFADWRTTLHVQYVKSAIAEETVLALIEAGGLGGVAEWRPSKAATGAFGTYELDPDRQIEAR